MIKTCQYCKKQFKAERSTRRFCSTKCRVAHNRLELRLSESNRKLVNEIEGLVILCEKYPQLVNPAMVDLRAMARVIKATYQKLSDMPRNLALFDDKDSE